MRNKRLGLVLVTGMLAVMTLGCSGGGGGETPAPAATTPAAGDATPATSPTSSVVHPGSFFVS